MSKIVVDQISGSSGEVKILSSVSGSGNLTLAGNLTVNGTTTTVDTTNMVVEDPLLVLAKNVTGTPTFDSGFIVERGTSTNQGFIWDESEDEFAVISTTEAGSTAGSVTIDAYADLHIKALHSAGSIGIGTTSPAMPLHIVDAAGGRIMLNRTTGDVSSQLGGILFGANDGDTNLAMIASYADGAADSGNLTFETEATSTGMTEKMRITSAGKVGIGTTSPSTALHVIGSATVSGTMYVGNTAEINDTSMVMKLTKSIKMEDGDLLMGVDTKDDSANKVLYVSQFTDNSDGPDVFLYEARGTRASPSYSQDGDDLGRYSFTTRHLHGQGTLKLLEMCRIQGTLDAGAGTTAAYGTMNFHVLQGNVGVPGPEILLTLSGSGEAYVYGDTYFKNSSVIVERGLVVNEDGDASGDFRVESDSQTHMLFVDASTGRVGIGTAAPNAKLHVAGEITIDSENAIRWENGNNQIYGSGDSGDSYIDVATSGTSRIRITNTGNIGIGTTSPAMPLHIVNASGGRMMLHRTSGDSSSQLGSIMFGANDGDTNLAMIASYQDGATDAAHIRFETEATGAGMTEKMRITSTGNVGIGTDSPSELLHLKSSADKKPELIIENTNSNEFSSVLRFYKSTTDEAASDQLGLIYFTGKDAADADATMAWIVGKAKTVDAGAEEGALHFGVASDGAATYSTLSLVGTGDAHSYNALFGDPAQSASSTKIGVHTSTPAKMLDINAKGSADGIQLTWNDADGSAADYATITIEDTNGKLKITTVDSDGEAGHIALMPDGNVGVGVASPSSKLEVDGDLKFSPTAISTAHITSAGSLTLRADANMTIGDSTVDSVRIGRTNTTAVKVHIRSGADTDLVVSNSKVGIGTDDPTAALEIDGDIKLTPTAISTAHITTEGSLTIRAEANILIGDSGVDSIKIGRTNTAYTRVHLRSGGANDLVVTGSKVGIGTDSPDMPLHIVNASGGRIMLHRTTGGTSDQLGAILFGANDGDTNLAMIASYQDGATDAAHIRFETEATGADMAERMRITSAGNVGIGTTSPTTTLDVDGSFRTGLVTLTADTSITAATHAGRTLLMGEVGGNASATFTLPEATGTGTVFRFIVSVVNISNYVIKVASASDTISGSVVMNTDVVTTVISFNTAADTDTITLNGTTTGGSSIGDEVTLTDIATDTWVVKGLVSGTGAEATPFSASVS